MFVVDRKRRRETGEGQGRPPVHIPWRHLLDLVVLIASRAAGVIRLPLPRARTKDVALHEEDTLPSEEALFNARLASLDAQNRTMGYLLQASIAKLDALLHPQPRVTPLQAPRTTIAASLRVKRERHTGPSSIKSYRGIMAAAFLLLVMPAAVMATAYGIVLAYEHYSSSYTPPEAIAALDQPIRGARIYDRNGTLLYEFIDDEAGQRFPVDIADISPNLLAATIATEDESFYSNPGVNPRGILRAAWENVSPYLTNEKDGALEGSGGSSITQQLVKNIYIPEEERTERSLDRKATEAALALELTKHYSKDQILQWYLNEISYGGLYHGIEAAAEGYFGVPASQLTLAQAALLAGIPQSPALYDPINRPEAALARRNQVLDLMATNQSIRIGDDTYYPPSQAIIDAAKQEPLGVKAPSYNIDAPHFVLNHIAPEVEALLGHDALYKDGLTITTTLDLNLQHETQDVLENWIDQYEATSNSHNGAVMVMDNKTGEVLVLIGSRDYNNEAIDGEVDNITALNSPGSTFKPFVYLTSFMKLGWLPSTIIADTPVTYRESDGSIFEPQNPTKGSYLGDIPIKTALGNSLNVPPFKAVM
jgi:membrane peptidoglycan carboxypeptidase